MAVSHAEALSGTWEVLGFGLEDVFNAQPVVPMVTSAKQSAMTGQRCI
jgi:hypothetical protein